MILESCGRARRVRQNLTLKWCWGREKQLFGCSDLRCKKLCCPLQAYHSQFNSEDKRLVGNLALLPVRTSYKGPAPKSSMSMCTHSSN